MDKLVLHSTAYNLGLVECGVSDIPSLLAAITEGTASLQTPSAPKKKITALLLTPPEPDIAKVLQQAIRCVVLRVFDSLFQSQEKYCCKHAFGALRQNDVVTNR